MAVLDFVGSYSPIDQKLSPDPVPDPVGSSKGGPDAQDLLGIRRGTPQKGPARSPRPSGWDSLLQSHPEGGEDIGLMALMASFPFWGSASVMTNHAHFSTKPRSNNPSPSPLPQVTVVYDRGVFLKNLSPWVREPRVIDQKIQIYLI